MWSLADLVSGLKTSWRYGLPIFGVSSYGSGLSLKAIAAGAVGTGAVASGVGAIGGGMALLGGTAGGLGAKIGSSGVGQAVTGSLERRGGRYTRKTVKQQIVEGTVKESFKAGKQYVRSRAKRKLTRRRAPARSRRAPARSRAALVDEGPRVRKVRRRSTRPPSAKQLAARARFKARYGGRRGSA